MKFNATLYNQSAMSIIQVAYQTCVFMETKKTSASEHREHQYRCALIVSQKVSTSFENIKGPVFKG